VSWNNKIMPLQALDDNGSGYTSSVTAAVYYAVDNGAKVINMSLGGDTNDTALATAIKYAYDRNVVVVAAAGNCGTGNEQGCTINAPGAMGYPALNPYVISVGATTSTGARASFSSYGPGLDVVAPGSGTLVSPMWMSSNQTSAYATSLYGTSFASPIVASYVGLLKSIRPSSTADDITALVDASAAKLSSMNGEPFTVQLGHGIIDTQTGLRVAGGLNQTSGTPDLLQTGSNISEHTFATSSQMASGCTAQAGAYCTIWAQNQSGYDRFLPYFQSDATGQASWSWTGGWLGSGDWKLRARSGDNRSTTPYGLFNR
jgi:serine protease